MAAGLVLQLIALAVFFTPGRRQRQVPMALAVARALGLGPSPDQIMSPRYRAALSAWRRHVIGTRRQAMAWRVAAVASMALCVSLAGALSQVLIRPAVALHAVQGNAPSRMPSGHASDVTLTDREASQPVAQGRVSWMNQMSPRPASKDPVVSVSYRRPEQADDDAGDTPDAPFSRSPA